RRDRCRASAQPARPDGGEMPVPPIVENQLPVQVLTYNEAVGIAEYKPIVAYFRQIRERPWLSVVVRSRVSGSQPRRVVCTDNHRFYREGAWVEARDLQPGDRVGHLADQLDGEARQIILGGLLGDSAIVRIGQHQTR